MAAAWGSFVDLGLPPVVMEMRWGKDGGNGPLLASEGLRLDCRIQLAEKFVKAVSKPSRPDMNPIR
jgi:hypothetical protein